MRHCMWAGAQAQAQTQAQNQAQTQAQPEPSGCQPSSQQANSQEGQAQNGNVVVISRYMLKGTNRECLRYMPRNAINQKCL